MRTRTRVGVAVLVSCAFGMTACSDDPTQPSNGGNGGSLAEADSIASIWMQALSDSLEAIPDDQDAEFYKTIRYTEIRDGMNQALNVNGASKVAHLGSGIMDVLEINYSADLWNLIDSLRTYDEGSTQLAGPIEAGLYVRPGSPILRNQFTLLATAPREYMRLAAAGIPSNLTVAELQRVIDDVVIAALSSAIGHLDVADSEGGPVLQLVVEDETHEIDVGEVFFFHAGVRAARAAFRIMTAYDLGLPGPDGTYGWVDDARNIERCDDHSLFEPIGGGSPYDRLLDIRYEDRNPTDAAAESLTVSIVQYNLNSASSDFLHQRTGGMAEAWQDLLAVRDLLAAAVAAIRTETDPQENDVIKIVDLTDLDDEITSDPDRPNFAQNFTTVEDVLAWVETVMTGPYQIQEDGSVGPVDLTVNLSAFFQGAPTDWRNLLPYYGFKLPDQWLTDELQSFGGWPVTPGTPQTAVGCDGIPIVSTNVAEYRREYRNVKIDPLEFLDSPGGTPIDLDVERLPYFPDYTFMGMFPGADRQKWIDILDATGN